VKCVDDLHLGDLKSARQVLERTPMGAPVADLAERLGLMTEGVHKAPVARRPFHQQISRLGSPQLSDEQSYWSSEFGRIVELIGVLQGQEKLIALRSKAARAQARARVRRQWEEGDETAKRSRITEGEVADAAEDDPVVQDLDEQTAVVAVLLSSALAAKEGTQMYLQAVSREITFRCAQMDARLH
jgi:hypothetical protein